MHRILAQTLKLPGADDQGVSLSYPEEFPDFKFASGKIGDIIQAAIPFIFAFAGIGLLLMILSAGFTLLTSAGDAKKLEAGQQKLTNAILGFVIIFVAYWLVQLAGIILGLPTHQIFK